MTGTSGDEGTDPGWQSRLVRLIPFFLPAATLLLLAVPGFRFAYLFDDYDMLGRVQTFRWSYLLPDPGVIFYRPVSREIYFSLLQWLSPARPVAGHILNAALMAGIVILGGGLAARLGGSRSGLIAGILIATFSQCPVLVAWVSGAQDLLAIAFTLLALHLGLSGRSVAALVVFGAAILSKETAIAAAPAMVGVQWLRARSKRSLLLAAARVSVLLAAWALIHPGLHVLAQRGGAEEHGSYIGLGNPSRWVSLLKSIPTLLNLPLRLPTSWRPEVIRAAALALVPFFMALRLLRAREEIPGSTSETDPLVDRKIAIWFGILLAAPPLFLTCFLVEWWVPYYMCFPAVGMSISIGSWLSGKPYRAVSALLSVFLVLGVWSRGVEFKKGALTEQGLAPAGLALPVLEQNFKKIAPSLPPGAVVYVTTMATGEQSVYRHIHHFQALRVWYSDPTIQTLRPERHVLSPSPELLFMIHPDLNVTQIDVQTLDVRSTASTIERSRYRSTLISYAIGVAGAGDVGRAVEILLRIDPSGAQSGAVDRRIAAMLLSSRGDVAGAARMVRDLPDLPPSVAFECVGMLLTVPTRGVALEEHALKAFGLSPEDPRVIRALLRALLSLGHYDVSQRLAERLLVLQPNDPEAREALVKIREAPRSLDQVTHETEKLRLPGE